MRTRTIHALTLVVMGGLAIVLACKPTVHPSDPTIPRQMCEPRCQRVHDCDPHSDVADCETRCEHQLGPRKVFDRPDYVASVRACAERQACVDDTYRAIGACIYDAFRRLEPSATDVILAQLCATGPPSRMPGHHCS
jgi:hypothetical protein